MHNSMAVNAALWNLVRGNDIPASAQIVVEYMLHLPQQSGFCLIYPSTSTRKSDAFTAHTEHGDIPIKDDLKEVKEEKVYGIKKERVGHFCVWREHRYIRFHHYWASDEATRSSTDDAPQEYVIYYSPSTKKAERFGHSVDRVWNLWILDVAYKMPQWHWTSKD